MSFTEDPTEFSEARQIPAHTFFIFDDMGVGQELRHVHGHTGYLVDPVAAVAQLCLTQLVIKKPGRDFPSQ